MQSQLLRLVPPARDTAALRHVCSVAPFDSMSLSTIHLDILKISRCQKMLCCGWCQVSLRDAVRFAAALPWAEAHGYRQAPLRGGEGQFWLPCEVCERGTTDLKIRISEFSVSGESGESDASKSMIERRRGTKAIPGHLISVAQSRNRRYCLGTCL